MKHQLSWQVIIIAQHRSQGHLLPRITASIDNTNYFETSCLNGRGNMHNNIAIGSLYRSDNVTTIQRIKSGSFVFVETKFIRIKQLRKNTSYVL
eukprot:scaffold8273_cov186-Skeletonema_menzelii.AAC.2